MIRAHKLVTNRSDTMKEKSLNEKITSQAVMKHFG